MALLQKEIIFAGNDAVESRRISMLVNKGILRKIAPRLYTSNLLDSPQNIVRRNLIDIIGWRLPGCVISHKSALLLRPTDNGTIYVTSSFNRRIQDIPGVTIVVLKGKNAIDSDIYLGQAGV